MTKKRRNSGSCQNKGHRQPRAAHLLHELCLCVPKDKAIKKLVIGNVVEATAVRHIYEASIFFACVFPKLDVKLHYCTASCESVPMELRSINPFPPPLFKREGTASRSPPKPMYRS
ncbi:40S ribosomal protein S26 [Galemys pyrenaicus]|uniref:40S ribosomal protein S26 n=1 Tax=Galemys pyrenaicus TaxID=202257 RepID=A0A8J6DUG6_GALPY|nr:40S ribosomal protein S26 [Galemys pyrenaicus]